MDDNTFLNPNCNTTFLPRQVRPLEEGFVTIYETYKSQRYKQFNQNVDQLFSFSEDYTIDDMYDISYYFNNFGFRSNFDYTFSENDQVWVFGDSNTVGAGNPYERVWINKIPKDFGTIYNLARHGSGVDTALRYLNTCLEFTKHKPKLIAVFGFFENRKDLMHTQSNLWKPLSPWFLDRPELLKEYYGITVEQAMEIINNSETEYHRIVNEFVSIANDHNIPVVWPSRYGELVGGKVLDYGRDVSKVSTVIELLKESSNGVPHKLLIEPKAHGGIKTQEYYYQFMATELEMHLK